MIKHKTSFSLLALLSLGSCSSDLVYMKDSSTDRGPEKASITEWIQETPSAQETPVERPLGQEDELPSLFGDEEEAVQIEWFKAGYYAGFKLGKSSLDSSSSDVDADLAARGYTSTTDLTNNDTTFSAYGGFRFTAPFSVELAWVNLGQVETSINASPPNVNVFLDDVANVHPFLGEGVSLRGIYHILDDERFQLGLTAGVWYWSAEVEAQAAGGQVARISENGLDPNFGIQGLVSLGDGYSFVMSWERYYLADNEADTLWFGLQGVL